MPVYQVKLRRIESLGVLADSPQEAASIAAIANRRTGGEVFEVAGQAVVICSVCMAAVMHGDGAVKDAVGEIFCDGCFQPEYDVVEPETEACDAVS